jgi:antirestriction protein ArdC
MANTAPPQKWQASDMIKAIEALIEKGETLPWHKPWASIGGMPRNLKTGKAYRGLNIWRLMLTGESCQFWVTAKQCEALGGKVKAGQEKSGTLCWFWKFPDKAEKAKGKRPWCMRFYVLNAMTQCEGLEDKLPAPVERKPHEAIEAAEAFVKGMPDAPRIETGGSKAAYSPMRDTIMLPEIGMFDSPEHFHATKFHEIGHWTGHGTRMDRDGVTMPHKFGDHGYSQEELVAEFFSAMAMAETGIQCDQTHKNSIAYLQHWLKVLKNDPEMLCRAASEAQKAIDWASGRQAEWEKAEKKAS